jgi:purine-nucleoside phosphorylase
MKPAASLYDRVHGAAAAVADRLDGSGAEVAVVLGSGLAAVADCLVGAHSAPYSTLPGFPETTVSGHPGRLACGTVGGKKSLVLCGRVHGYEGYAPDEVGFGIRVAATLGVRTIIITNVSGAVDPSLKTGEIVLISDHLNLTCRSPLTGVNDERLGPRFVDMTDVYTPSLRKLATEVALSEQQTTLREAVYAGLPGPQYETPAEVRMLRGLGAGLVGMSTVWEVIVARHSGCEVLGLSLVANAAAGVEEAPLSHEEVTRAANAGAGRMTRLIVATLNRLSSREGA